MNERELIQTFTLANHFKEGDLLVGGTHDDRLRQDARKLLSSLVLGDITKARFVDDGITAILSSSLDAELAAEISHLTVQETKSLLLGHKGADWARRYSRGMASEVIAAVAKVMDNDELSTVARSLFNPLPGEGVGIGSRGHFGSRLQPNSPGDNEDEILFSILEGLTYGCGDVILGINPASDDLDAIIFLEELLGRVRDRLQLPTRYSVLSDMVKQTSARARVAVDVGFQSLAGTSSALTGMLGMDVDGLVELARGFDGLYFETGQGSAVTNGAADGVDMVTLESRAYGLARYIQRQTGAWTIVNDVAGFIGPEVFRSADQLLRACLEDIVMGKLHGLTMGLDVCSTFHMAIDPASLDLLTDQIARMAAPAYFMAVPGNADPMLGYLTTSFRQHPRLRGQTGKQISTPMKKRLSALGVMSETGSVSPSRSATESLYAAYMKAGGDSRSLAAIGDEGKRKLDLIQGRGYDLGYGYGRAQSTPAAAQTRIDNLYAHARRALYAPLDDSVLRDASSNHVRVRTRALTRDDYLSHPRSGEVILDEDEARVASLYPSRRPRVQIVVSDGLNANAINENLRSVLPALKSILAQAGHHVGNSDVIIDNGRVRAGYHVGALVKVEIIIHLIGERPGTGLNALSAYLTYGRDEHGTLRWGPDLDHSSTTAICGINRRGKTPAAAVEEIARCVQRIVEERRSGVSLGHRAF
jgi:ethanolamine ammonia-lyase large subunit